MQLPEEVILAANNCLLELDNDKNKVVDQLKTFWSEERGEPLPHEIEHLARYSMDLVQILKLADNQNPN